MKKVMMIFTTFLLVFVGAWPSLACVVCDERVNGNAAIAVLTNHGDYNTGGFAIGDASGAFFAVSHNYAFGNAGAQGTALGESFEGPNFAFSFSSADVFSNASAYGNCYLNGGISGSARQANWAQTGLGANFAAGGNYTEGAYQGYFWGAGFRGLLGGADAFGTTTVFHFSTPTSEQAGGNTFGISSAWLQGMGDPSVFGTGSLMTQSYLSSGNRTGLAFGAGNASYGANGPRWASGSLNITGFSSVNLLPHGVSASSYVSSSSSANSH